MTAHNNRKILIAGATGGIGRAVTELVASQGAKVWIADLNLEAAQKVADAITSQGYEARALLLNGTSEESWDALATAIKEEDGELHGLVNCIGISFRNGLVDTSYDDWKRVMSINLDSAFLGMKSVHELLKASGDASIVNISSIAGLVGYFSPTYGASKWAVRGLSQSAALEFAPDKIRVNSIHPGLVNTPLLHSGKDSSFVDESLKGVPAERIAEPQEIANVISFLLSAAASYVTGSEFVADGGLTSGGIYKQITGRINQ